MDIFDGLNLTALQVTILVTVVAGVTELYNRAISRDFKTVGKIAIAVLTGTLIGLNYGLDLVSSMAVGFVAPGAMTVIGSFGNKSEATPRTVTGKALTK